MRLPLTQYGLREMLIATVVCAALAAAALATFPPATVVPAALWLFALAFFRDPDRRGDEDNALLSAADGVVADVTPLAEDSLLGSPGVRIGVFMSLFDVHVNRSPCPATVTAIERHEGGYLDARLSSASERNESATIRLSVRHGGQDHVLIVRQIAGLIARRIVTDLKLGQSLAAGERIGMIKFGSRVEVLAPRGLIGQVVVAAGQTVRGGRSVLIRLPRQEQP